MSRTENDRSPQGKWTKRHASQFPTKGGQPYAARQGRTALAGGATVSVSPGGKEDPKKRRQARRPQGARPAKVDLGRGPACRGRVRHGRCAAVPPPTARPAPARLDPIPNAVPLSFRRLHPPGPGDTRRHSARAAAPHGNGKDGDDVADRPPLGLNDRICPGHRIRRTRCHFCGQDSNPAPLLRQQWRSASRPQLPAANRRPPPPLPSEAPGFASDRHRRATAEPEGEFRGAPEKAQASPGIREGMSAYSYDAAWPLAKAAWRLERFLAPDRSGFQRILAETGAQRRAQCADGGRAAASSHHAHHSLALECRAIIIPAARSQPRPVLSDRGPRRSSFRRRGSQAHHYSSGSSRPSTASSRCNARCSPSEERRECFVAGGRRGMTI